MAYRLSNIGAVHHWLSPNRKAKDTVVVSQWDWTSQQSRSNARAPGNSWSASGSRSALESWTRKFWYQWRNAWATGQMNLPATVRTSRQKVEASFFQVLFCRLPPRGVAHIKGVSTSNDLITRPAILICHWVLTLWEIRVLHSLKIYFLLDPLWF